MLGSGTFLREVLSALNLDFTCCNSESENVRQSELKERAAHRAAIGKSPFVDEEDEEAVTRSHLPRILGTPPSSPKHGHRPTSGSGTPTSASSQANGYDLPMGQKIHSDPLTSVSGCSETSTEVVDDAGARYRGQWHGDQRHGHGVLIQIDGERYEGQFRNGLAHGRGFLVDVDCSLYEGQWVEDKKHGFGMYTFPDGTTYQGQWVEGKKHGTGSEQWADGAKFEGQFAEGFKNGAGIYRAGSGTEYIGQFQNDKMHGIGTYVFECGRKYSGHWNDGRMNGHGKMEFTNGMMYEGNYENSLKSGVGTVSLPDGSSYCGEWSAGKQHGKGVHTDPQGVCWHEAWENGSRVSSTQADGGILAPATTPKMSSLTPPSGAKGGASLPKLPFTGFLDNEESPRSGAGNVPLVASEGSPSPTA